MGCCWRFIWYLAVRIESSRSADINSQQSCFIWIGMRFSAQMVKIRQAQTYYPGDSTVEALLVQRHQQRFGLFACRACGQHRVDGSDP